MDWQPITDLPQSWADMAHDDLWALAKVWNEQKQRLQDISYYQKFLDEMRRQIAIETGVIESLYTLDRGITQILIEQGIEESLIPHNTTDKAPSEVVALIRDHESAMEGLFDFIGSNRQLSTSYIKQLHQLLTRNQEYVDAVDQFGKRFKTALLRGDWKKTSNNPLRHNGTTHNYCPPEQTASQMDQLITWHLEHENNGVNPEVEAAWLHHRFAQIHPFQDGNGRVARMLVSLVFIRAGWFPLVITRDDRAIYIQALENADAGDLVPLIKLFARVQRQTFIKTLSLSEDVLSEQATVQATIDSVVGWLKKEKEIRDEEKRDTVEQYAEKLINIAETRIRAFADELKSALRQVMDEPVIQVRAEHANGVDAHYYWREIVEQAKKHSYYANLKDYKSWVRLSIITGDMPTHIILSFHTLGYEHQGIKVCSAFAFRRLHSSNSDEDTPSLPQDLESLCEVPFQFTYLETEDKLKRNFKKWLETVLVLGLEYWRRGL